MEHARNVKQDTRRAVTMLGDQGDTTIYWNEDQDDAMEAIIEEKMKQGIQFFIIENRPLGGPPMQRKLEDAAEARKHRAIAIKDEQFAAFVAAGKGDVVKTPDAPVKTTRRAKSPKDAAKNQSVGVRPLKGG